MSKKTLTIVWLITGLAVLVLTFATVRLAARAKSQAVFGSTVYLVGRKSTIKLHESPDPASPVAAALVRGSTVTILDSAVAGEQTWYLIQKGDMPPGWISAEYISQNSP